MVIILPLGLSFGRCDSFGEHGAQSIRFVDERVHLLSRDLAGSNQQA
jgi:hypothetical protein